MVVVMVVVWQRGAVANDGLPASRWIQGVSAMGSPSSQTCQGWSDGIQIKTFFFSSFFFLNNCRSACLRKQTWTPVPLAVVSRVSQVRRH